MDDILDVIQDVAESMSLYDIQRVPLTPRRWPMSPRKAAFWSSRWSSCCTAWTTHRPSSSICHEIDELESEADRMLRAAMSKVFREEPDVRQVIKLKEMYELLESVTDRCKDVAGTVEAIVLENS
jgi:uncharacterized protein Yka (UPF0111/DUF47 family)